MPRVHLPATTPKRHARKKECIIGQKRLLLPKWVWATRARLELVGNLRDLALFNVAIASKVQFFAVARDGASRVIRRRSMVQMWPDMPKTARKFTHEVAGTLRERIDWRGFAKQKQSASTPRQPAI